MTNSELWKQYEEYTQQVTDVCRKLGYGAIAVVWVFKTPQNEIPDGFYPALGFTVAYFAADLLQFVSAALILRSWIRHAEKEKHGQLGTIETHYDKPHWVDFPAACLWCAKIVLLLIAYAKIGATLFSL